MLKTLALAGVTAMLVIGSIAVAQTTGSTTSNYGSGGAMSGANQNNAGAAPADQNAASAGQYGSNASATTGQTAGERG